ncbi:hypothetical protein HDV03_001582, partial [Kappamyces sp. JEL0829]
YYAFITRLIQDRSAFLAIDIVAGIGCAVQAVLTLYCISCNVEDDVVIKANKSRNIEYVKVSGVPVIDPDTNYCNICQVHVKHLTKHCKTCNKCVEGYDHHCIFMSTCIGSKNYRHFLGAISLASLVGLYFGAMGVYAFFVYFTDPSYFRQTLLRSAALSQLAEIWIQIFVFLYSALVLTAAIGLGYLFVFHARLVYVGLTTVGYNDLRRARGPPLWEINTKEFRENMRQAEQHRVNYHEIYNDQPSS